MNLAQQWGLVESSRTSILREKTRAGSFKKIRAGGNGRPGYEMSSEADLQTELDQTGQVNGVRYHTEVRVVVAAAGSVWWSKLWMVKEVEKLCPEFDVYSFTD